MSGSDSALVFVAGTETSGVRDVPFKYEKKKRPFYNST